MHLLGCVHFITYKKLWYTSDFPLDFKSRGSNNEISVSKALVGRHRTTNTREDKAKAPHFAETSLAHQARTSSHQLPTRGGSRSPTARTKI